MGKELPIPNGAKRDRDSAEVFRAWIVGTGLQVSLQRGFDEPGMWGILLADVARHAARVYATENVCSEEEALGQIAAMLDAELNRSTDIGATEAIKQVN